MPHRLDVHVFCRPPRQDETSYGYGYQFGTRHDMFINTWNEWWAGVLWLFGFPSNPEGEENLFRNLSEDVSCTSVIGVFLSFRQLHGGAGISHAALKDFDCVICNSNSTSHLPYHRSAAFSTLGGEKAKKRWDRVVSPLLEISISLHNVQQHLGHLWGQNKLLL